MEKDLGVFGGSGMGTRIDSSGGKGNSVGLNGKQEADWGNDFDPWRADTYAEQLTVWASSKAMWCRDNRQKA